MRGRDTLLKYFGNFGNYCIRYIVDHVKLTSFSFEVCATGTFRLPIKGEKEIDAHGVLMCSIYTVVVLITTASNTRLAYYS